MALQATEAKEGRIKWKGVPQMTELHDVAMFCLFYSGVVMYSLWLTIGRKPAKVPVRNR